MDNVFVLFTVALAIGIACLVALPADAQTTCEPAGGITAKFITGWGNTYGEAERQAYSYLSQYDVIKILEETQGFDGTHEPRPYFHRIKALVAN